MTKHLQAVAMALLVGAALVGCGGSTSDKPSSSSRTTTTTTDTTEEAPEDVDADDIESRIEKFLSSGSLPGVEVECPDLIAPEVGASFDCTLSGDAIEGTATATLIDASGKEFSLKYEYTNGPSTKGNGNATSVP